MLKVSENKQGLYEFLTQLEYILVEGGIKKTPFEQFCRYTLKEKILHLIVQKMEENLRNLDYKPHVQGIAGMIKFKGKHGKDFIINLSIEEVEENEED